MERTRGTLSRGSASVSELAEPLDMTLAAVVQHVQVLEQSGVITTEKVGEHWAVASFEADFREGGFERSRFRPKDGLQMGNDTFWTCPRTRW